MIGLIGDRLAELREEKGLKQRELADKLHLSKSTISTYERDKHCPEYKILIRIANYFDVTTDYILDNSNKKQSDKLLDKKLLDICSYREILEIIDSLSPASQKTAYDVICALQCKDKAKK